MNDESSHPTESAAPGGRKTPRQSRILERGNGLRSREVIKQLKADGWKAVRQEGSHVQFRHDTKPGTVTVPHPKSDLAIGTLKGIEKQSGLKLR